MNVDVAYAGQYFKRECQPIGAGANDSIFVDCYVFSPMRGQQLWQKALKGGKFLLPF